MSPLFQSNEIPHPFQVITERNKRLQRETPGFPRNRAFPDDLLIANLVAHGNPRWSAEQLRNNDQLRMVATAFLFDCEDAERGDRSAKERVDYIKAQWEAARREELIADDPKRMHQHIVDPRTLL